MNPSIEAVKKDKVNLVVFWLGAERLIVDIEELRAERLS